MGSTATDIAKTPPTLEHPDGSPIRALVVDDECMLEELVSVALKMIGWGVKSAGEGPAALAIARVHGRSHDSPAPPGAALWCCRHQ